MTVRRVFSYVNVHGRYYPMIPVVIRAKHITRLYALVGSGATVSWGIYWTTVPHILG